MLVEVGGFQSQDRISGGFLCKKKKKKGANTHPVQLRVSPDLKRDSGSEAQRVKRWRRAQRKRGKKMCAAVKIQKSHEILKSIQNI